MLLFRTRTACVKAAVVMFAFAIVTIPGVAAPTFSAWSEPIHLGPFVNSDANEQGPAISRNGLSLFFASARADGVGNFDIWVSQRGCVGDSWGPPVNVLALNSSAVDTLPSLSPDEHWMFFTSSRFPGGLGDNDLWAAYRADRRNDFGWEPPVNLGSNVNSAFFDASPELTRRRGAVGPLLYFARGPSFPTQDIYVSELARDGAFGAPAPVVELNSAASDAAVSVRRDGLEIFFHSNRPGVGLNDLWMSMRRRVTDPWLPPVNLGGPVNSPFNEIHPELSRSGRTLYFASGRPRPGTVTPPGTTDLWLTTRTKLDGVGEPHGCEDEAVEEEEEG